MKCSKCGEVTTRGIETNTGMCWTCFFPTTDRRPK